MPGSGTATGVLEGDRLSRLAPAGEEPERERRRLGEEERLVRPSKRDDTASLEAGARGSARSDRLVDSRLDERRLDLLHAPPGMPLTEEGRGARDVR